MKMQHNVMYTLYKTFRISKKKKDSFYRETNSAQLKMKFLLH